MKKIVLMLCCMLAFSAIAEAQSVTKTTHKKACQDRCGDNGYFDDSQTVIYMYLNG